MTDALSTSAPPLITLARAGQPFVLLDDARAGSQVAARLFTNPRAIIRADDADGVTTLLTQLDAWQSQGAWTAGWMSYEAGMALEPRTRALMPEQSAQNWPLGWFAAFDAPQRIAPEAVPGLLPDPAGAALGRVTPRVTADDHAAALGRLLEAITAGDIYQANLTFNADVAIFGHPLAAYARLRSHARAGYGGVVFTGTHWLLSLSPELFLSVRDGQVMARPMKGTAAREEDAAADANAATALGADPKQRAENLMIVDLIRNDLSRIAVPGSVSVPALFRVETYPTIHQMVSDVTCRVEPALPISTLFRATFPCGSITGAPKLQAMATIAAVEREPRGAYTGAIGFAAPDGEAAFNVAIRTLMIAQENGLHDGICHATLGLGSGIVADSRVAAEWEECLAKGQFVDAAAARFDLLETMAFDPETGIALLELHLERLGESARGFGHGFDRHAIRNRLQHLCFRQREAAMLRLRLGRSGALAITLQPMPPAPEAPVAVQLAPLPVDRDDVRLRHKTSDRAFYDAARVASGAFEVLFFEEDGSLTEGSFTSLFVPRDGQMLTPPANAAALRGILQRHLLASGEAREARLTRDDLHDGFFIGNAVRGLMPARLDAAAQ